MPPHKDVIAMNDLMAGRQHPSSSTDEILRHVHDEIRQYHRILETFEQDGVHQAVLLCMRCVDTALETRICLVTSRLTDTEKTILLHYGALHETAEDTTATLEELISLLRAFCR